MWTVRSIRVFAALAAVAVIAAACGGTASENSGGVNRHKGGKGTLTVADAGFTESEILANMYADVLAKAGYKVNETSVKSSDILIPSLSKGQVTVLPEYVATFADQLNAVINGADAPSVASPSLSKSLAALKRLGAKKGITPLKPSNAVDQNAFAVSKSFAKQHHLKTLSDLGRSGLPVKLAAGSDCITRPFCKSGLERTYGIKITKIDKLGVDTPQTKQAVQHGVDQLALVLTTDATVPDYNLVTLTDDKHLQNADYLVPVVSTKKLKPDIESALNKLAPKITTSTLAQLNKKVDQGQQKPGAVAADFLRSNGLL